MLIVRFRGSMAGFNIDRTIKGYTPDEVVVGLRNYIATRIPNIPFTQKDDRYREWLDVDKKDDWTDEEFWVNMTKFFNKEKKKFDPKFEPVSVPTSNKEFILLAEELKLAKVLQGFELLI